MERSPASSEQTAGPAVEGMRSTDDLAALYRVTSQRASNGFPPDEVIDAVCELVSCESALLFVYDEETDTLRMQSSEEDGESVVPLTEPSIIRRVFLSGTAEIVNDVAADSDPGFFLADIVRARQVIALPLVASDKRLGVLAAVDALKGSFTQDDLRVLTALADRAALAIENARLKVTLERQSQEMEGLHRLSRLLTASDTLDHVVGESVHIVADLLSCEKVALLLYDEGQDALVAHPRVVGIGDQQVEQLSISLREPSLPGTVYRTGTPLVSNDARHDAWVGPSLADLLQMRCVLAAPLATGAGASGVLIAVNPRKHAFESDDLRFIMLLGSRIASVIGLSLARQRERALVQRLREADRTKSDFVSILAHELWGPMTSIIGFGKSLQSEWDAINEAKKLRIIDIITKEVDRLSRLVSDLLDVSRMEAGTLRYDFEPVDLVDVIDNMLSVHTSLHIEHEVETDIAPGLPKVVGDRDRIRQIFLNLLSNAVRYSPAGTVVKISARPVSLDGGEYVEVSIADQGIGIARGDMDRLFTKFAMLPKPGWSKKGTGLGLYITKGIVEGHGGRIRVESEPNRGSIFSFALPLA